MKMRSNRCRSSWCYGVERLEPRQLLAAQVYEGPLTGKIVYTSPGHGWQWSDTLNRYATDRGDNNEIVEDFGNQDQFSYYADYVLRAGGTVVPMRPVGHQTREIVLDNDSTGVTFTGSWSNTAGGDYYDEDYGAAADAIGFKFASPNAASETALATYQPTFAVAGFYPVYTWALDGTNRTNQLYRINHTGGTTEIRVDHRDVGQGWVYLGTYHFNSGSSASGNVQISNLSSFGGAAVIADAIRFGNGMGDWTDAGAPGPSGYPREDENSYKWIMRSLGVGTTANEAIGSGTTNVSAPSNFAEWMNNAPFGDAVYIGFHSNAGGGRGARGLIDADSVDRTPHQSDLATYLGRQINQDMQALDGTFEYDWIDGVSHTFTGEFGELDLGANGEFDATIIETAFHDSVEDAAIMRDPKGREQIARSVYEGTLEYFDNWGNLNAPVVQPDKPTAVRAIANTAGDVTITWAAPATRAGGPAAATGYLVYTSRNGYGFSDPRSPVGTATSLTIPAAQLDGNAYYFKVAAFNAGGEGPASTVVGARKNGVGGGGGTNRILIVNGFDRYDRTQNERYGYAFDAQADNLTDRVRRRHNNTFDYVARFGEAVEAYTANGTGVALGFDTAENEQVADNTVNLNNYQTVLWISGTESTENETLSSTEQSRINTFLSAGNRRLFVSGAEIGWDLDRPSGPTTADRTFYNQRLRADYVADEVPTYDAAGVPGSIFSGISLTFDNGNNSNDDNVYDVQFADVLAPINGSALAMNYTSAAPNGAAVQWADPEFASAGARGVNMGFPFETITTAANRNAVMAAVLNFFQTAVSTTPTSVDLLAADDTGSSNSDNRTNRNNTSGKTLRFVVGGTVAGSTVNVYAGSTLIGTATGLAGSTTVTTNGTIALSDAAHTITAKQLEANKSLSPASPGLSVTIDTAAPAADLVNVIPNPRISGVDSTTITFTRAVSGFDLSDLTLTRNGGANLLTGGQTLTTSDNITFTLNNLTSLTDTAGTYVLTLTAAGSGIVDSLAGNALSANATDTWVNNLPAWLAPGSVATWQTGNKILFVTGAATIIADPGSDLPQVTISGAGASLTINPASDLKVQFLSLTMVDGATAVVPSLGGARTAANHRVLYVAGPTFSIDANSTLDLADNDLVINYHNPGTFPASVEADVRSAYNVTGDWLGKGITSSIAAQDGNFVLAVADNAALAAPFGTAQGGPLFAGVDVDLTTVLVKFTHRADVNLDGRVTPDDSAVFGGNYEENGFANWATGDLNFDGLFTPDDSAIFGGSYDESLPIV